MTSFQGQHVHGIYGCKGMSWWWYWGLFSESLPSLLCVVIFFVLHEHCLKIFVKANLGYHSAESSHIEQGWDSWEPVGATIFMTMKDFYFSWTQFVQNGITISPVQRTCDDVRYHSLFLFIPFPFNCPVNSVFQLHRNTVIELSIGTSLYSMKAHHPVLLRSMGYGWETVPSVHPTIQDDCGQSDTKMVPNSPPSV